jgi:hypothetical protein
MIRIINNTDLSDERLLILYAKEIQSVKHKNIESIVFDPSRMVVFGIDCLILETE